MEIQRNPSPGARPGSSVKEAISSGGIAFLVWIPANPTRFQQILANPREPQRILPHSRFLERSLGPRQSRPNHWREMEFIEDPNEPTWITTDPNTIQETALPVLCTHRFARQVQYFRGVDLNKGTLVPEGSLGAIWGSFCSLLGCLWVLWGLSCWPSGVP